MDTENFSEAGLLIVTEGFCCHGCPTDEICKPCEDDDRGDREYTQQREEEDE